MENNTDKVSIYFNRQKAIQKILLGIAFMIIPFLLITYGEGFGALISFLEFSLFFVGCSFIFYASKSISKEAQIIVSNEGVYFGFKLKKTIPWERIEKIMIKQREVDYRNVKFLEVVTRIKTNGPSNILVHTFAIENLEINSVDLELMLNDHLGKSRRLNFLK